MLQINTNNFASDALEDAMRLAQTKSLNSYTFSDCLNYLNYAWRDIYDKMAMIENGYYGTNIELKTRLTHLPPFVKSSVQVYSAQSPVDYNRIVYRSADNMEMTSSNTYKISGNDIYCYDVTRRKVWLYFVPACPQVFFTHHNRDPKVFTEDVAPVRNVMYNLQKLVCYANDTEVDITTADREALKAIDKVTLVHRGTQDVIDITENVVSGTGDEESGDWKITYITCDFPYIFITYENSITSEHVSGFLDSNLQFNRYNPFDFTGRNSDVEYLKCHWNDKTGMSVIIKDYNDNGNIKELGWTPDTRLDYPVPEMYRLLVARLADKLSALNESNIMGVQKELIEAQFAFNAFLDKDKSSWKRITNVNPPTVNDWL